MSLKRYTLPEIEEIWKPETKYGKWLEVELAMLDARAELGELPRDAAKAIREHAKVNVARINELDKEFEHDLIAFVVSIQESLVGTPAEPWKDEIHKKMTSYDTEDPALVLQLRTATLKIIVELTKLRAALDVQAKRHRNTLMIGRTHGQHAQPTTFGHLLLVFRSAVNRSIKRLGEALDSELHVAKISGAVGNFASVDPALAEAALYRLGLKMAKHETQILQRDRHAMLLSAFATAAGTIEQMFLTFWGMMRSEIGELEEPRVAKQKGSSAMPHKKNPILTERLIGMARLIRAYASAAAENVATPDFRDISQSCVERVVFPDSTAYLHYMARKATAIVENLVVHPERMRENLDAMRGVWASQQVRDALIEAGVPYVEAYDYTQKASFTAARERRPFLDLLETEPVSERDSRTAKDILCDKLEKMFDAAEYVRAGNEFLFQD